MFLPVIDICGTAFEVDLRRLEFRQLANPTNRISFYDLVDNGDHLLLFYDTRTRNAAQSMPVRLLPNGKIRAVRLPPLKELDPFLYALFQGRGDTRLDQLKKAAKIFESPTAHRPGRSHKLK